MVTARSRPCERPGDYQPRSLTASSMTLVARVESVDERTRGLTAPGGGDELSQFLDVDRSQSNQDCWEAVVVRLGKEFLLVGCEEHVLLEEVTDAHSQHARVGNAGLLRRDALEPDPDEEPLLVAVANGKREAFFGRRRSGQRHGDASDVVLVRHLTRLDSCTRHIALLAELPHT